MDFNLNDLIFHIYSKRNTLLYGLTRRVPKLLYTRVVITYFKIKDGSSEVVNHNQIKTDYEP